MCCPSAVTYSFFHLIVCFMLMRVGARKGPIVLDFQAGRISEPVQDIGLEDVQILVPHAFIPESPEAFQSASQRPFNKGKRQLEGVVRFLYTYISFWSMHLLLYEGFPFSDVLSPECSFFLYW